MPERYSKAQLEILARAAANRHGVDPDLYVRMLRRESGLRTDAVSRAGAIGPAQIMPATAAEYGVDPSDVPKNIDLGARYFRQMLDEFGGDTRLALAAYNAGPGRVWRAGGVPNIRETREYVAALSGATTGGEVGGLTVRQALPAELAAKYDPSLMTRRGRALLEFRLPTTLTPEQADEANRLIAAGLARHTKTAALARRVRRGRRLGASGLTLRGQFAPDVVNRVAIMREQFSRLPLGTRLGMQFIGSAAGAIPSFRREPEEIVPAPEGYPERAASVLGGLGGFIATSAPAFQALRAVRLGQVAAGAISAGVAGGAPAGTGVERGVRAGVMAAGSLVSHGVSRTVANVILGNTVGRGIARETSDRIEKSVANHVGDLVSRNPSITREALRQEADRARAVLLRRHLSSLPPSAFPSAARFRAAQAAGAVIGGTTFGALVPYAEAGLLGHDMAAIPLDESALSAAELTFINLLMGGRAFLRPPTQPRAVSGPQPPGAPGAPAPTPAGPTPTTAGPSPTEATAGVPSPVAPRRPSPRLRAFMSALWPTPPPDRPDLSRQQAELSKRLQGLIVGHHARIDAPSGPRRVRVLSATVSPFETNKVRVLVQDFDANALVVLQFQDVRHMSEVLRVTTPGLAAAEPVPPAELVPRRRPEPGAVLVPEAEIAGARERFRADQQRRDVLLKRAERLLKRAERLERQALKKPERKQAARQRRAAALRAEAEALGAPAEPPVRPKLAAPAPKPVPPKPTPSPTPEAPQRGRRLERRGVPREVAELSPEQREILATGYAEQHRLMVEARDTKGAAALLQRLQAGDEASRRAAELIEQRAAPARAAPAAPAAPAAFKPGRILLSGFEFGSEADAQRMAGIIAKQQPGSDPVVKLGRGARRRYVIEINEPQPGPRPRPTGRPAPPPAPTQPRGERPTRPGEAGPALRDVALADMLSNLPNRALLVRLLREGADDKTLTMNLAEGVGQGGGSTSGRLRYRYGNDTPRTAAGTGVWLEYVDEGGRQRRISAQQIVHLLRESKAAPEPEAAPPEAPPRPPAPPAAPTVPGKPLRQLGLGGEVGGVFGMAPPAEGRPEAPRAAFLSEFDRLVRAGRPVTEARAEAEKASGEGPPPGFDAEARAKTIAFEEAKARGQADLFGPPPEGPRREPPPFPVGAEREPAALSREPTAPVGAEPARAAEALGEGRIVPIPGGVNSLEVGIDVPRFQRRRGVNERGAVEAEVQSLLRKSRGVYDPSAMEAAPLVVWRDAEGQIGAKGKVYVLDGHHRLEIASHSWEERGGEYLRTGRVSRNLPAVEFRGTLEEAQRYADAANLRVKPPAFLERAELAREMEERGATAEEIADELRVSKPKAKRMADFGHLDRDVQSTYFPQEHEGAVPYGEALGGAVRRHPEHYTPDVQRKYLNMVASGEIGNVNDFNAVLRQNNAILEAWKQQGMFPEMMEQTRLSMNRAVVRVDRHIRQQVSQLESAVKALGKGSERGAPEEVQRAGRWALKEIERVNALRDRFHAKAVAERIEQAVSKGEKVDEAVGRIIAEIEAEIGKPTPADYLDTKDPPPPGGMGSFPAMHARWLNWLLLKNIPRAYDRFLRSLRREEKSYRWQYRGQTVMRERLDQPYEMDPISETAATRLLVAAKVLGGQHLLPPGLARESVSMEPRMSWHYAHFLESMREAVDLAALERMTPGSRLSRELFDALENPGASPGLKPIAEWFRAAYDEMYAREVQVARSLGRPIPKYRKNYAPHVVIGEIGALTDAIIREMLSGRVTPENVKEYRNRFHEIRMDDPLFERDAIYAFHARLAAHASYMEKLPFAHKVNEWLKLHGRDNPWEAEQVRNWAEAYLFPKKTVAEQHFDSALRFMALTKMSGGVLPVTADEATVHSRQSAEQLAARGFKRFYFVPKGARVHSTARARPTGPMEKPQHRVQYTRSTGEKVDIGSLHSKHLTNILRKMKAEGRERSDPEYRALRAEFAYRLGSRRRAKPLPDPTEVIGTTPAGHEIVGVRRGHLRGVDMPIARAWLENMNKSWIDLRLKFSGKAHDLDARLERWLRFRQDVARWERDPTQAMMAMLGRNQLRALLGYNTRALFQNSLQTVLTTLPEIASYLGSPWNPVAWARAGTIVGKAYGRQIGVMRRRAARAMVDAYEGSGHLTKDEARQARSLIKLSAEDVLPEAIGSLQGELTREQRRFQQAQLAPADAYRRILRGASPLAPYGFVEDFTRGVDAIAVSMVAQRLGLKPIDRAKLYAGTRKGELEAWRDVSGQVSDPRTAVSFAATHAFRTMFHYNPLGQGLLYGGPFSRWFLKLTTFPIHFAVNYELRPLAGVAAVGAAAARGLIRAATGGGFGRKRPGPASWMWRPKHRGRYPDPANAIERWLEAGGAGFAQRHAAKVFLWHVAITGALLGLSEATGVNATIVGIPGYAYAMLTMLRVAFPDEERYKRWLQLASRGVVFNYTRGVLGFFGPAANLAFDFINESRRGWSQFRRTLEEGENLVASAQSGAKAAFQAPLELVRQLAVPALVQIRRTVVINPDFFDRHDWVYPALGVRSVIRGATPLEALQFTLGVLPPAREAALRERLEPVRRRVKKRAGRSFEARIPRIPVGATP